MANKATCFYGFTITSTLRTANNLGTLYANQSKMAEAEAMYLRALQGYEKARESLEAKRSGCIRKHNGKPYRREAQFRVWGRLWSIYTAITMGIT
jgi:hypothetical protein